MYYICMLFSKGEEEEGSQYMSSCQFIYMYHNDVYMYITAAGIVFGTSIPKSMSSFKRVKVAKCTALIDISSYEHSPPSCSNLDM